MTFSQSAAYSPGLQSSLTYASSAEWRTQINSLATPLRQKLNDDDLTHYCQTAHPSLKPSPSSAECSMGWVETHNEEEVAREEDQGRLLIAPFGYIFKAPETVTRLVASKDRQISIFATLTSRNCTGLSKRIGRSARKKRQVRFEEQSMKCESCEGSGNPCIFAVGRQRPSACEQCHRDKSKCSGVPSKNRERSCASLSKLTFSLSNQSS